MTYEGNILRLLKVTRADMGAYLCIASNGVPPTISKRIMVSVHCKSSGSFHLVTLPIAIVSSPGSVVVVSKDRKTLLLCNYVK